MDEEEDPIVAQARRRVSTLRAKLAQNEDFKELERLQGFLDTYEQLATRGNGYRVGRQPSDPGLLPYLEQVLASSDRPLSTKELLAKAQERGMNVGGSNPARNLSARLSANPKFMVAQDGSGWVLNPAERLV